MATPPQLPPPGQLWYNSPTFSDVVVIVESGGRDLRIHAHKIVLAAASQVFGDHFKTLPQDTEVDIDDLIPVAILGVCENSISFEIFEMVFQHMYGMPIDWGLLTSSELGHLCRAAEGLGVHTVCERAAEVLEKRLCDVVEDDNDLLKFCDMLEGILFYPELEPGRERKWSTATKVVAKTCCLWYESLKNTLEFCGLSKRYPMLQTAMLNHFASRYNGSLREFG